MSTGEKFLADFSVHEKQEFLIWFRKTEVLLSRPLKCDGCDLG